VPVHIAPASIRCHTLVLRTQPSLLEILLPSNPRQLGSNVEVGDQEVAASLSGCVRQAIDYAEYVPKSPSLTGRETLGDSMEHSFDCTPERLPDYERMVEVTVDDEPEVFIEMIRFVYLNTCHVDQGNVKAMMQMADKYGIEDIVVHCLQWMQDHFTATLFYQFLSFELTSARFVRLLRNSLRQALRSRRHFSLVTGADSQWEELPVPFVEELLSGDELPIVSEAEVLHLISRWASGALERERRSKSPVLPAQEAKLTPCSGLSSLPTTEDALGNQQAAPGETTELDGSCSGEGRAESSGSRRSSEEHRGSLPFRSGSQERRDRTGYGSNTTASLDMSYNQEMLRLLRVFRKSDSLVKVSDIEPILDMLNLKGVFSSKPPRETVALDPGFVVYRGVAGVNVPGTFGELHRANVVSHPWRGSSVSLGSLDFLEQRDGFRPSSVPEGEVAIFPRLWVKLISSSWAHTEKKRSKSAASIRGNSFSGPIGADPMSSWDSMSSTFVSTMTPVTEGAEKAPPTLKTMQSQDDWEIGSRKARPSSAVPNLGDSEKIDHKVICAVLSGGMRHGIRLGQIERSSIYNIEDLNALDEDICSLGGSPTEVEFELQLTVRGPSPTGICRCSLAVMPSGGGTCGPRDHSTLGRASGKTVGSIASEGHSMGTCGAGQSQPLLEVCFDASAEEHLHFHVSSHHFDSNSSYNVALNWVLRPGMARVC